MFGRDWVVKCNTALSGCLSVLDWNGAASGFSVALVFCCSQIAVWCFRWQLRHLKFDLHDEIWWLSAKQLKQSLLRLTHSVLASTVGTFLQSEGLCCSPQNWHVVLLGLVGLDTFCLSVRLRLVLLLPAKKNAVGNPGSLWVLLLVGYLSLSLWLFSALVASTGCCHGHGPYYASAR